MPSVWLIIIAVSGVGGPTVEHIPFVTLEACVASVEGMQKQKPRWMQESTIMVCSDTGKR